MSNKVHTTLDGLENEIMKYLKEYKEDINDDVKELSKRIIKEATQELKQISPKAKKRVYLRKWKTKNESDWQEPRELC